MKLYIYQEYSFGSKSLYSLYIQQSLSSFFVLLRSIFVYMCNTSPVFIIVLFNYTWEPKCLTLCYITNKRFNGEMLAVFFLHVIEVQVLENLF